ncbi:MAG TPA: DNA-binding protein [Nitrospirota bacterium]|nr:DNA-binding protein [Nitrospirota bacterium]
MRTIPAVAFAIIVTLASAAAPAKPVDAAAPSPGTAMPSPSERSGEGALSGKVVETMNAGGYTYVCVQKSGKKTWVAVPETQVKVGENVTFQPGQEMKGFTSKSLGRSFDSIIFSGGIANEASAGDQGKTVDTNHGGSKAAVVKTTEKIKVEKAEGANAYTVAEIFAQKAKLDQKTVVVRAKVVKVSANIMGKNWIHLQDGTGDASKGTNDLVATSDDRPEVGVVVTAKGTVAKDKDFGAGYKYTVIMEKTSIQK